MGNLVGCIDSSIWIRWNSVAKNCVFKLRNNSCLMLGLKSLSCQGWRVVNRGGQSCWGDLTTFPLSPLDSERLGAAGWYFGDDYPGDHPHWCGSGATTAMLCANRHSFWTGKWYCKLQVLLVFEVLDLRRQVGDEIVITAPTGFQMVASDGCWHRVCDWVQWFVRVVHSNWLVAGLCLDIHWVQQQETTLS